MSDGPGFWVRFRALGDNPALRAARRLVVTVIGATVLLAGIALLVLPGPAFLVIPLGLAILATEFVWARRLLERVRRAIAGPSGGADPNSRRDTSPRSVDSMTAGGGRFPAVLVLAGSRGSEGDFVRASGAEHRALIEVGGSPLLIHVLRALRAQPRCGPIGVSTDALGERLASAAIARHGVSAPERWFRSEGSPVRSVLRALEINASFPTLVTTADHALLTPEILEEFLDPATREAADLVVGVVPSERVQERYPSNTRTLLRFRGEHLCGANLFLLRTPASRAAIEFWRRVETDRKRPLRLLRHFGPSAALRFALRRLRFDDALEIAGSRFGCRVGAVRLLTPEAAIDVDTPADQALVDEILRRRRRSEGGQGAAGTRPSGG